MAKKETQQDVRTVSLGQFLNELPELAFNKGNLSQHLQELPLEKQLLSLADVSIERETEGLREIFIALKKL